MRIIIKISYMGNFLFREISAVTESQRGAEYAIRQKGKKTAHGLRYDCPDGRLSSIILHVVYPLIRQSYDRYKLYIPDVVWEVKWEKKVGPDVDWKIQKNSVILKKMFNRNLPDFGRREYIWIEVLTM